MNEKLEKLNQEIEKTEARLRRAQHKEKMLEHQSCLFRLIILGLSVRIQLLKDGLSLLLIHDTQMEKL